MLPAGFLFLVQIFLAEKSGNNKRIERLSNDSTALNNCYQFELGWGQISKHCWSNMTSQLIIQCCRGWPNCPTCGVQQCVTMCAEQC